MALIFTPTTVSSGYNTGQINANFTALATLLKEAVNRGKSDTGNDMGQNYDMGNKDIINVKDIYATDIIVGGTSIASQVAAAAASAAAALVSENNAATSESNAATSESNASASATLAQEWAVSASIVAATDYSAKMYASDTTDSTLTGSAREWASTTGRAIASTEYSAKEWAVGTFLRGWIDGGAARDWARLTGTTVNGADYSAKEYAVGTTVAAGSAKDWAIEAEDVLVDGVGYSAYHWAQKAALTSGLGPLKCSSDDTTLGYLEDKIVGANGLTTSTLNPAANEDVQVGVGTHLDINGAANNYTLNVYNAGTNILQMTNATTGTSPTDGLQITLDTTVGYAGFVNREQIDTVLTAANQITAAILYDASNNDFAIYGSTSLYSINRPVFYVDTSANKVHICPSDAAPAGSNTALFDIYRGSAAGTYMAIGNQNTGHTDTLGFFIGVDASGNAEVDLRSNKNMIFSTNNTTRTTLYNTGGLVHGSPTGGDKGAGTINAQGVYDDNVLLTDYVFDKYFGDETFDYSTRVQLKKDTLDPSLFDPKIYAEHWTQNHRLPNMPDLDDTIDGVVQLSHGDMIQRLVEQLELQAIHIEYLRQKIED